jgi:hypothetical protein
MAKNYAQSGKSYAQSDKNCTQNNAYISKMTLKSFIKLAQGDNYAQGLSSNDSASIF